MARTGQNKSKNMLYGKGPGPLLNAVLDLHATSDWLVRSVICDNAFD